MSYCRSNGVDSDVYVIGNGVSLECFGGGWKLEAIKPVHEVTEFPDWEYTPDKGVVMLGTTHHGPSTFHTKSRRDMIDHLQRHRMAGHKVPDYALDRLRREIRDEGDLYV